MPMESARCLFLVVSTLSRNVLQIILSTGERQQVMYDFYDIKEFPLVLGTVDGTLMPIKAPSVDEHLYVCRKGYIT
jgi:hypothetical protein